MKQVLVILLMLSTCASAQDHFPLQVGNVWQYIVQFDTNSRSRRAIVGDTVMPNGKSYAKMEYTFLSYPPTFSYVREDGPLVYQYEPSDSAEYIIYDFSKHYRDIVSILPGNDTVFCWGAHADTVLGLPTTVYSFRRTWSTDRIADGIGPMEYSWDPPTFEDLEGAIIGGVSYGIVTGVEGSSRTPLPGGYELGDNFPNPFNPSTAFDFTLPVESRVRITIINPLGQTVATLLDGVEPPGEQKLRWNAGNVGSGVYFYRLEAASVGDAGRSYMQVKRMMLVK